MLSGINVWCERGHRNQEPWVNGMIMTLTIGFQCFVVLIE